MLYNKLIRPILFTLDPETAHEWGIQALSILAKASPVCSLLKRFLLCEKNPVKAFGLTFPNCIGQAAGLDKDGMFPASSEALGFGFVEVGTVTPLPQSGNVRPRLFRFPQHLALVNRMGFNNRGAEALKQSLAEKFPSHLRAIPLGINLGKGKSTPLSDALTDYCSGFDIAASQADYITINISSPNTPDLRKLQKGEFLDPLLLGIKEHRNKWAKENNRVSPPCLLKISPDESFKDLEIIIGKAMEYQFDGVIACNTSIKPPEQMKKSVALPDGGISGKPIETRANQVIKFIDRLTDSKFPIIGSGGIYDYDSAQRKLDSGACLLQIYTSVIYEGPLWPSRLAKRMPLAKSF